MRPELDNLKGPAYYAAWDNLMLTLGEEILTLTNALLAWGNVEEVGIYGAVCGKFDLPLKTLVQWLERQKIIVRGFYDAFVSGLYREDVLAKGAALLTAFEGGLTYAAWWESQRAERERLYREKMALKLDLEMPLVNRALDHKNRVIRPGDLVEVRLGNNKGKQIRVKEIRMNNRKPDKVYLYFEWDGELHSQRSTSFVLVDSFYGETEPRPVSE